MPTLTGQIHALDNTTAARLLRAFARANSTAEQTLALTSDISGRSTGGESLLFFRR